MKPRMTSYVSSLIQKSFFAKIALISLFLFSSHLNAQKQQFIRNGLVVCIGGASDKLFVKAVQDMEKSLAAQLKPIGVHTQYFTWDKQKYVADFIEKYNERFPNVPIVVIGHSYGADTAVRLVPRALKKAKISLILSLDAVSRSKGVDSFPRNTLKWVNVYTTKKSFNGGIAGLGGHWLSESEATKNIRSTTLDHVDANSMLNLAIDHFRAALRTRPIYEGGTVYVNNTSKNIYLATVYAQFGKPSNGKFTSHMIRTVTVFPNKREKVLFASDNAYAQRSNVRGETRVLQAWTHFRKVTPQDLYGGQWLRPSQKTRSFTLDQSNTVKVTQASANDNSRSHFVVAPDLQMAQKIFTGYPNIQLSNAKLSSQTTGLNYKNVFTQTVRSSVDAVVGPLDSKSQINLLRNMVFQSNRSFNYGKKPKFMDVYANKLANMLEATKKIEMNLHYSQIDQGRDRLEIQLSK